MTTPTTTIPVTLLTPCEYEHTRHSSMHSALAQAHANRMQETAYMPRIMQRDPSFFEQYIALNTSTVLRFDGLRLTLVLDGGAILSLATLGEGLAIWSITSDGETIAHGTADTVDAAYLAARQAIA